MLRDIKEMMDQRKRAENDFKRSIRAYVSEIIEEIMDVFDNNDINPVGNEPEVEVMAFSEGIFVQMNTKEGRELMKIYSEGHSIKDYCEAILK